MKYMYFCERCKSTFEVETAEDAEIPAAATCPKCEYPHAVMLFPMTGEQGGNCAPQSGC